MPTLYNPLTGSHEHHTWHQLQDGGVSLFGEILSSPHNAGILQHLQVTNPTQFGFPGDLMPTVNVNKTKTTKAKSKPIGTLEIPKNFTIGADPELFIKTANGEIICADMIPGTKDKPHKVEHGAVQRDGFAAEYNIDPCETFEEWNRNHKAVQGQLKDMLPKGCTLVARPSHRFSPEIFAAAPDSAKELGCSPDWNAWDAALNPPVYRDPADPYLCCIGGHVHVGWLPKGQEGYDCRDIQHMLNCFDLSKQMDWYLGAWALQYDKDTDRRRLYGRAGSCRIKDYGVEYRVLSSFWVLEKTLRLEVWNRTVRAIEMMNSAFLPETQPSGYNQLLQHSINDGKLAPEIARNYPVPVLKLAA